MNRQARAPAVHSAGGLLWRRSMDRGVLVALVHRPRNDDWTLPKGTIEPGEHPLLAACREVVEETGHRPVVGRRLPSQSYLVIPDRTTPDPPPTAGNARGAPERRLPLGSDHPGRPKTVRYWAMRTDDSPVSPLDSEVDTVLWCTPTEAFRRLSYRGDRAVLRAFGSAPAEVTMVLLVQAHPGPDRANLLRDLLVWFAPRRILAADPTGCVRTVGPLATALGCDIEPAPPLPTPEAGGHRYRPVLDLLRDTGSGGVPTVLCLPDNTADMMVASVSDEDGLDSVVGAPVPGHRPPVGGDSLWALAFHAGRLVAADYYPDFTAPKPSPAV